MLSPEHLSHATYALLNALDGPADRVQTVLAALTAIAAAAAFVPVFERGLTLSAIERLAIVAALNQHNGVQRRAAKQLGIAPRVIGYKIKLAKIQFVRTGDLVRAA